MANYSVQSSLKEFYIYRKYIVQDVSLAHIANEFKETYQNTLQIVLNEHNKFLDLLHSKITYFDREVTISDGEVILI